MPNVYCSTVRMARIRIATRSVKWDLDYQRRHKVRIAQAQNLSDEQQAHIVKTTRRICRRLGLDGYVRIDFRLTPDGDLFFLEANPNPDVARGEEFSSAAKAASLSYEGMLQKMLNLGLRRAQKT